MTAAFTFPINEILEKAFQLREEQPELSIDDMIKEILPTINIKIHSDVPVNLRKKTMKDELLEKEKKKELSLDERCMARTIYENIHLEPNGLLKVMRDDPKNQYGDRCKCRKRDSGHFCTRHSGWQSLGVWNGEYSGKFSEYVEKTENGPICKITYDEEPPKPVSKPEPKKKNVEPIKKEKMVKPACLSVKPASTGEPNFSVKPASAGDACLSVKPASKSNSDVTVKPFSPVVDNEQIEEDADEDSVIAFPIVIDGSEYNIDDSNNVYTDDGDLVGIYDRLKKSWLRKI